MSTNVSVCVCGGGGQGVDLRSATGGDMVVIHGGDKSKTFLRLPNVDVEENYSQ